MTDSNDQRSELPRGRTRNLERKIEEIFSSLQDLRGRSFPRFLSNRVPKADYFLRLGSRGPELVFPLDQSRGGEESTSREVSIHRICRRIITTCRPLPAGIAVSEKEAGRRLIRGPLASLWQRYRLALVILICALVAMASFADWGSRSTHATDRIEMARLATRRAAGGEDYLQMSRLINRLIYGGAGTRGVLMLHDEEQDFIEQEIARLMKEFGAEEYRVPLEFVQAMGHFITQYQERDRDLIARVLVEESPRMNRVRQILRSDHLPEDLAYMALVESRFQTSSLSQEGAAGFWQFTESTAREYGMVVNDQVDERLDLGKSTQAASRYIRDLILDFGAGSSVLLAMAAYNGGPDRVRRAMKNVKDPIKQRNFWYLYSTQALPAETREYVPKVFAAIIIGRNPQHFGF